MSGRSIVIYSLMFAASLIIRDIALGLIFSPITTFVFAEIHNEKETSEKEAKEGAKEIDEYRLPFNHLHLHFASETTASLPHADVSFYPSVIAEVQGRPPEVA